MDVKNGLKVAGKITKYVVWKGVKAVAGAAAVVALFTWVQTGREGLHEVTLDDYLTKDPVMDMIKGKKSEEEEA